MDKIVPAFETTLFDSTLSSSCINMAELGIDSLLDDGVFKSIPIVSTLIGIGKTAQNLHDRNLLKQTVKFINTFNEKNIHPQKLQKYKDHLKSDSKYAEEELGRVLILLNSNVDIKKSEILARFYRAYVEELISWEKFCELSDVASRLFIADIKLLLSVHNKEVSDTSQCIGYQAERLMALGLLNSAMKTMTIGSASGGNTQKYIQVNELGNLFCQLGFN